MPKKFATENPKVTAARDRKETAKKTEHEKKAKAAEDALWVDDDKLANRKLQRKDDEERKRLEALKRKEENRKLAEEEMNTLAAAKAKAAPVAQKVTRAAIDQRKEAEQRLREAEEAQAKLEAQKIEPAVEHLEENLNVLNVGAEGASTIDEALEILGAGGEDIDKHPEKRMRAAYLAFEEANMPRLKKEHPTFRLSQLKQILKKDWMKSPENPLNARLLAMNK